MIRIGISLSTKILSKFRLLDALRIIEEKGYTGAEIWVEQIWEESEGLERLKKYLQKSGLTVTLHAPGGDLNLSSTNRELRQLSVKQIQESIQLASSLDIRIITVHPGRKTSGKDNLDQIWELQLASFQQILHTAEENGVYVGIENMENRAKELVTMPEDLERILSYCPGRYAGITLDLAHIVTLKSPSLADYLLLLGDNAGKIVNVHISDASGEHTHLPLGWGNQNLHRQLGILRKYYRGNIVIEGAVPGKEMTVVNNNISFWRGSTSDSIKGLGR